MKKIITVALSVVFLVGVFTVVAPVQAASLSEIQKQLQSLLKQVSQLRVEVGGQQGAAAAENWCFTFKNNLRMGDTGRQVANLQIALQKEGYAIDKREINNKRFGDSTKSAVIGFQEKYSLVPVAGYFGTLTRAQLNQLYGCGGTSSSSSSSSAWSSSSSTSSTTWSSSSSSSSATSTSPITVVSPNGGEKWEVGETRIIKWASADLPSDARVSVTLCNKMSTGGCNNQSISGKNLPSTQTEFLWTIPQGINSGNNYFVKVDAFIFYPSQGLNPGESRWIAGDSSDAPFSIVGAGTTTQPVISNISPSSGPIGTKVDLIVKNSTHSNNIIQFGPIAIPNIYADLQPVTPVSVEHLFFTVPQSGPASCNIDGICTKDLVTIKPGIYPVRFKNANGESNSVNFEVIDATSSPTITITAPNGGEKWQIGSMHTITWTPYEPDSDINPADSVTAYLEQLNSAGQFITLGKVEEMGKASIHWTGGIIDEQGYYSAKPGTYYIRVINNVTGGWDRSDKPFQLLAYDAITADLKINNSDGPLRVLNENIRTASWTSNAEACNIYNSTSPEGDFDKGIYNLPPSGKLSIKLFPNNESYDTSIWLSCASKGNTEGHASDRVVILPSGAPKFSVEVVTPNGGELVDWSSSWSPLVLKLSSVNKVSVALYKNNKFFAWIKKDEPLYYEGSGWLSLGWQPSSVISQDKIGKNVFKIYVIGQKTNGKGSVTDKSDKPFTIVNMPKG